MPHVWTIEVNSVTRKWKRIEYSMSLNSDPTEFSAIIEYSSNISYFQYVEIKNNGTVEFAGYVESIIPSWDKSGRILEISGRYISVILWKKFTERFSDSRLDGFFGAVDPAKLIGFLLRCPISDLPSASSFHKIGWGLDTTNWIVSAIRTGEGREEDWVKIREVGLAWQLGPIYDNSCFNVNGFTNDDNDWDTVGASPWLGDDNFISTYIETGPPNSLLTANADAGQPYATVANASIFIVGDNVRISEGVGSGTNEGRSIIGINGNILEFEANLINSYTVGGGGGVWKRDNIIIDGFTFEDLSHTNGHITSAYIDLFGRWFADSWSFLGEVNSNVAVYVDVGSGYTLAGTATWSVGEYPVGLGYAIIKKSVNCSSIVNTFAKANACKVKLIFTGVDATKSGCRISEMRLRITGASYQTNGDWFEVNFGADKNRICGIIIESRMNSNKYAKNYVIETSPSSTSWTTRATQNNNSARDIIESWTPVNNVRKIRIRLTANANYEWEISQIYVYSADDNKYCVWGTLQLRKLITMQATGYINCVESDIGKRVEYAGFEFGTLVSYDNGTRKWLIDDDGTLNLNYGNYVEVTGGTGKGYVSTVASVYNGGPYLSGTLTSEDYIGTYGTITPMNIPFSRVSDGINDVVKKCHDVNYDIWEWWVDLSKNVHFEDRRGSPKPEISFVKGTNLEGVAKEGKTSGVVSRTRIVGKSESKKQDEVSSEWKVNDEGQDDLGTFFEEVESSKRVSDKDTADVIANVKVQNEGEPEEVFTVKVSNDTYNPLAYVVGDDVTITDSLTEMSGTYRIMAINKIITENGEDITLYCGSKWKDISDEWASIRRQLREVGLGNTIIEDWLAGGSNQEKLDAEKITGEWEKSAKNDDQKPPADKTDDGWEISTENYSQDITTDDSWFRLRGSKDAGNTRTLEAYVKNIEGATPNIRFDKSPKFVCDFKIPVTYEDPNLILNPTEPTSWRDGDYIYIRMFNASNRGFGFRILKQDGLYNLYFGLNDTSGGYWYKATQTAVGTSVNIVSNTKYRLEAVVDWDARQVKYYFNNELLGIIAFGSAESGSSTMFPIYTFLSTSNPTDGIIYWAWIYIYKWRAEWEWVA